MGSSKIAVRTKKPGSSTSHTRLIEAVESLLMQGWDENWFVPPQDPEWWKAIPNVNGNVHKFIDLITNMSGNAFSVFHLAPLTLTLMSTLGKFTVVPGKMKSIGENAAEAEEDDEDVAGNVGEPFSVTSSDCE